MLVNLLLHAFMIPTVPKIVLGRLRFYHQGYHIMFPLLTQSLISDNFLYGILVPILMIIFFPNLIAVLKIPVSKPAHSEIFITFFVVFRILVCPCLCDVLGKDALEHGAMFINIFIQPAQVAFFDINVCQGMALGVAMRILGSEGDGWRRGVSAFKCEVEHAVRRVGVDVVGGCVAGSRPSQVLTGHVAIPNVRGSCLH